jgi:endoglucanase
MYAARITGTLAGSERAYAGFGINFVDPKGPFDASAFDGIAFFARRGADSPANVRLKVPDGNTDPDGKTCSECFNDFGADLELQTQWQQFTFRFDELGQMPGWGAPRPGSIDSKRVFGVQWQVAAAGTSYELWIDDVVFFGCRK